MRLAREARTIGHMIGIYCRGMHRVRSGLCEDCATLKDYALKRIGFCRFGSDKPVCAKCKVHCYKPTMREQVRAVMRYAGPRMLLRHPILAIGHMIDSTRLREA